MCNQNTLFFIIKDCINRRKALFYLKALLGKNFFANLIKFQLSTPVKLRQNFCLEIISNSTATAQKT